MEGIQNNVTQNLMVMFPMRPAEQILQCVTHPRNCYEPVTEEALLNRCMDDLLSRDSSPDPTGILEEPDNDVFAVLPEIDDMMEPLMDVQEDGESSALEQTKDTLTDGLNWRQKQDEDMVGESPKDTQPVTDKDSQIKKDAKPATVSRAPNNEDKVKDSDEVIEVKEDNTDFQNLPDFQTLQEEEGIIDLTLESPVRAHTILELDIEPEGLQVSKNHGNISNHVKADVNLMKGGQIGASNSQVSASSSVESLQSKPLLNFSNNRNSAGLQSAIKLMSEGTNRLNNNNSGINGCLNSGGIFNRSGNTIGQNRSATVSSNSSPSFMSTSLPARDLFHAVRQSKPATLSRAPSDDGKSTIQRQITNSAVASSVSSNAGIPNYQKVHLNGAIGHTSVSTPSNPAGSTPRTYPSGASSFHNGPSHSNFQGAQFQISYPGRSCQVSTALPTHKSREPKPATLSRAPSDDRVLVTSSQSTRPVSIAASNSTAQSTNRLILPKTVAVTNSVGPPPNPPSVLRPAVFNPSGSVVVPGMAGFKQHTGLASVPQTNNAKVTATSQRGKQNDPKSNSVRTSVNTSTSTVQTPQVAAKTPNALERVPSQNKPTVAIPQVQNPRQIAPANHGRLVGQVKDMNQQLLQRVKSLQRKLERQQAYPFGNPVPFPAQFPNPYVPPVPRFQPLPLPNLQIEPFDLPPLNPPLPRPGLPLHPPLPRPGLPVQPPLPRPGLPVPPPLARPGIGMGTPDVPGPAGNVEVINDEEQSAIVTLQLQEVLKLFPSAEEAFVRARLVQFQQTGDPVNYTCNHLLENGDYPRKTTAPPAGAKEPEKTPEVDFIKNWKTRGFIPNHTQYFSQGLDLLANDFTKISKTSLRAVLQSLFHGCYVKTKKTLDDAVQSNPIVKQMINSPGNASSFYVEDEGRKIEIRLLKKARQPMIQNFGTMHPQLQKEVDFYKKLLRTENEKADFEVALKLNEDQYEKEGQLIECGCCYLEVTFENMVQCLEGHLFCQTCLQSYTKEAVFGQGKATLSCLEDGCDSVFPRSQLEKTLSHEILEKYDERVVEESINLADVDNLLRCPNCNFAAVLDEDHKVFSCPECYKDTCRDCKEPWKDHFGLACDEVKKQSKMRLTYQERMTEAKIRTCYKCGARFCKSEGCNKMTCRCGAKMCYICRKAIKDYSHFDNRNAPPHGQLYVQRPGEKCRLWTNAEEDDDRAIKEIEKEMKEEENRLRQKSALQTDSKRSEPDSGASGSDAKRSRTI